MSDSPPEAGLAGVVVPAHNEERAIGRLLTALTGTGTVPVEVVVVCNGCTDRTADVARSFAGVRVVETPTPSKREALRLGDDHAELFPRVYVDADVVIDAASLEALLHPLDDAGVLATAPERFLDPTRVGLLVRWYYDVWQRLPQVRDGLFGRGVIAMSRAGHERVRALPPVMSDDLVVSEAFSAPERRVVPGARVVIYPPRTVRDLLRRRVRVVTGNTEADQRGLRHDEAKTTWADLGRIALHDPRLAVRMPVFVGVTVLARLAAARAVRRGDFSTWLRDESSRS